MDTRACSEVLPTKGFVPSGRGSGALSRGPGEVHLEKSRSHHRQRTRQERQVRTPHLEHAGNSVSPGQAAQIYPHGPSYPQGLDSENAFSTPQHLLQ